MEKKPSHHHHGYHHSHSHHHHTHDDQKGKDDTQPKKDDTKKKKPIHFKLVTLPFYTHDAKDKYHKHFKEVLGKNEAQELRNIQTGPLFKGLLLNKYMFDNKQNRVGTKDKYPSGSWGDPSKTYQLGPAGDKKQYFPPFDWIGYGLKADTKTDRKWLDRDGWWNAYHGVRAPDADAGGKKVIGAIAKDGFKAGGGQAYAGNADSRHPGNTIGTGCYFSPDPQVADSYAANGFNHNGNNYKVAFKVRINPQNVRIPAEQPDYWICDGTPKDVKSTTLLVKKV